VIGVGEEIQKHAKLFASESVFFRDTTQLVTGLNSLSPRLRDSVILLKGARSFGFEKVSRMMQQKSHDTVFEVDLNKLASNVNYYRSLLSPNVKLMGMVKAMGYGSGSAEVAGLLQHMGFSYLAVAYADEGVELRQAGISLPIMVMNPEADAFEDIINYNLEPEIYSFKTLRDFAGALDDHSAPSGWPVHIKIDTGMHRLGFMAKDTGELSRLLSETPQLRVASVFSHLAASDTESLDDFTTEQIRSFSAACEVIEKSTGYKFLRHICNSGAITRFPGAHYDMVRLGIGMYGVAVNSAEQEQLQNVGTLKTTISQIKSLKAGQTVGYSRKGVLQKDSDIAVIPIGYADGFSRQLGNGAHGVYVNRKFCRTVGNICMDMCMIDVTGVGCAERDEVIIFNNPQQLNALAEAMHTIPYEILTSVSSRVKRIYVQE
jgi:Alr-MurF fusion protein